MTFQETQAHNSSQKHVADLLPAYLNRTLDIASVERVREHLLACQECQHELQTWEALRSATRFVAATTPTPSAQVVNNVLAIIDKDAPSQQVASRRWFSTGILYHLWLVFKRQVPILHKSIWIATALIMLFGCFLALFAAIQVHSAIHQTEIILSLITTMSSAAGMAFIFGEENDASLEVTLATPTSIRIVMLSRLLLVLGYNFTLSAVASALIALAHGGSIWDIMQLWVGPMLLLSSVTLTLSLIIGSWFALLGATILEVGQAIAVNFSQHVPRLHLSFLAMWQSTPVVFFLAIILIVFTVLYAPRHPRLSH